MSSQELFYRRWRLSSGRSGSDGPQELEEVGTGTSGEEGSRMCDDIGVLSVSIVETNSDTAWVSVWVCVGDVWNTS